MPFQQVDPKYFDFASRFMQGQQQAVDRNAQQSEISRRNALLAMEQQAATQQNTLFNQGQQDRTAEMEQKSLQRLLNAASNLEGVANDPNAFDAVKGQVFSNPELVPILQKYGLSPEMVTPKSVAQFNAQLRAAGSAAAPQPQAQEGFSLSQGQQRFDASGKRIASVAPAPNQDNGPAPSYRDIIDPTNPKQMITVDGRLYRGGGIGSPGVLGVAGKESSAAVAEQKRGTGKEAVTNLIVQLKDLYGQLGESGAIVDPENDSISNVFARARASGVGQFTGGVFGTQDQTTRDTIVQMRPQLLNAIRQASGMSARAIDSNAELKLWLSAVSDPTRSLPANMAILDQIDKQYGTAGDALSAQDGPASADEGWEDL